MGFDLFIWFLVVFMVVFMVFVLVFLGGSWCFVVNFGEYCFFWWFLVIHVGSCGLMVLLGCFGIY